MAVIWKKLAYLDDVVAKALFDANTILAADSDNTPAAVTVAEQRIVGRITAGTIAALTAAQVNTLLGTAPAGTIPNVANAAARPPSPALGDLIFQVDELAYYGCTAIA